MLSTHHSLALTTRDGAKVRGTVVYVQRLAHDVGAQVHIETCNVLETGYRYPAVYATPGQEAMGSYLVLAIAATAQRRWLCKGIFTRA